MTTARLMMLSRSRLSWRMLLDAPRLGLRWYVSSEDTLEEALKQACEFLEGEAFYCLQEEDPRFTIEISEGAHT